MPSLLVRAVGRRRQPARHLAHFAQRDHRRGAAGGMGILGKLCSTGCWLGVDNNLSKPISSSVRRMSTVGPMPYPDFSVFSVAELSQCHRSRRGRNLVLQTLRRPPANPARPALDSTTPTAFKPGSRSPRQHNAARPLTRSLELVQPPPASPSSSSGAASSARASPLRAPRSTSSERASG